MVYDGKKVKHFSQTNTLPRRVGVGAEVGVGVAVGVVGLLGLAVRLAAIVEVPVMKRGKLRLFPFSHFLAVECRTGGI